MDLAGKYEKSNLLGDGEVKVWRGRDKATRTPVLLHQISDNPRLLRLAVEYLLTKPPGSPLLEMGEIGEATCLVTVSELEMLDVTAWLENALRTGKPASGPPPAPPVPLPMPAPLPRPREWIRLAQCRLRRRIPGRCPSLRRFSNRANLPEPSKSPGRLLRAWRIRLRAAALPNLPRPRPSG